MLQNHKFIQNHKFAYTKSQIYATKSQKSHILIQNHKFMLRKSDKFLIQNHNDLYYKIIDFIW